MRWANRLPHELAQVSVRLTDANLGHPSKK